MNISSGTIARTIVLFLALVNQVCAIMGFSPLEISEDAVYQLVTLVVTVGASAWAWWRNNSFTPQAIKADDLLKQLKNE